MKLTHIELHIGRKPIIAAGNSDGDYQMMEHTLSGNSPSMAILVNHDDETREYSYMHGTEKAVEDAAEKEWNVVRMKDDFKEIFGKYVIIENSLPFIVSSNEQFRQAIN